MNHAHVWHDSFTRATWLIHTCDMTHSHIWHDTFFPLKMIPYTLLSRAAFGEMKDFCVLTWLIHMCVTWRTHTRDTSHSYQKCALMLYMVALCAWMSHANYITLCLVPLRITCLNESCQLYHTVSCAPTHYVPECSTGGLRHIFAPIVHLFLQESK